ANTPIIEEKCADYRQRLQMSGFLNPPCLRTLSVANIVLCIQAQVNSRPMIYVRTLFVTGNAGSSVGLKAVQPHAQYR
ncbi:MAG: hypothetical protein WCT12_31485, partial [Verrucomicrobiota bacterium]